MTSLQNLIAAASDDDVPVAVLLRKLKVVAARLGTVSLEEWVHYELQGYPADAELPAYRAERESRVLGEFGAFGSQARNIPIPRAAFPERMHHLFRIRFAEPIAVIERLSEARETLEVPWPANMIGYTNWLMEQGEVTLLGPELGLQQARQVFPPATMTAVVDAVRIRVLDVALALEAVAPRAGEVAPPSEDRERAQHVVMNIIGGNVAVASSKVRQQSTLQVTVGDRSQLFQALTQTGFEAEELEALEAALNEDEAADEGFGPRVKAWVGEMAMKGGSAVGRGAAAGAGGLAVELLGQYFGIGP